ncbi:Src kinase-associated phosphoprotein 2 [Dissostichus eleginoides]|uniref:Src kinase-associated phosphoprotein 2 n=1 Tax=Dissostichus eleginoides TaxID=100907 RepID=A0AAD9FBU4_DISEL|nr:Src kinase-associated phosphoprotein 2 [Dissostichus eleginoides]
MRAIPEELTTLISDLEYFISDGLKGENLSKKAKEKGMPSSDGFKSSNWVSQTISRTEFLFVLLGGDEEDDEEEVDSNNDGGSQQSERTDKDEDAGEGAQQSPPVAAQDLTSVFKAGYLEKRRKDHSFFGTEWQKRWCALSQNTFYYYGNKQQKGEFSIDGYTVKINSTLRKDSKKDCCFEITAPDKRVYQFCASSVREAEEWVKQIDFVLKDMTGIIPVDEEEEPDVYDDVDIPASEPIDEDIYEELPEDDLPTPAKPPPKVEPASKPSPPAAVDKSTDYPNFYQGLWDCSGDQPDELTFKRGDAIYILSKEYQSCGWWVGEKNGSIGIVPKDYLMELYAI